jgi:hypothetical protein
MWSLATPTGLLVESGNVIAQTPPAAAWFLHTAEQRTRVLESAIAQRKEDAARYEDERARLFDSGIAQRKEDAVTDVEDFPDRPSTGSGSESDGDFLALWYPRPQFSAVWSRRACLMLPRAGAPPAYVLVWNQFSHLLANPDDPPPPPGHGIALHNRW